MNQTFFEAIHYDIHLDMKNDYTLSANFPRKIFMRTWNSVSPMWKRKKTNITIAVIRSNEEKYLVQDT